MDADNIKPAKRYKKSQYPLYSDSDLSTIMRFLAAYASYAEIAYEKEKQLAKGHETHPAFAGRVSYWRNVLSGIRWLSVEAVKGQRHLAEITDDEIAEIQQRCLEQFET